MSKVYAQLNRPFGFNGDAHFGSAEESNDVYIGTPTILATNDTYYVSWGIDFESESVDTPFSAGDVVELNYMDGGSIDVTDYTMSFGDVIEDATPVFTSGYLRAVMVGDVAIMVCKDQWNNLYALRKGSAIVIGGKDEEDDGFADFYAEPDPVPYGTTEQPPSDFSDLFNWRDSEPYSKYTQFGAVDYTIGAYYWDWNDETQLASWSVAMYNGDDNFLTNGSFIPEDLAILQALILT